MNSRFAILGAAAILAGTPALADDLADGLADGLAVVQHDWDAAKYQSSDKAARNDAFVAAMKHAAELSARYPDRAEAHAWEGIVLSTYAGEVGAMSAMKYAKAARAALEKAEKLDATALDGGVYASLGALYSKVPGGLIGFGDDKLAARYFEKALAVDADNIDNNFFYGEFLLDQGQYARARTALEHALQAPPVASRPVFDAGRRAEIQDLLEVARRKAS
jgi:tetratricopeptide (TPR) repeat protein